MLKDTSCTLEDSEIVLAIFSPNRAKLTSHRGYNIRVLKDKFRSIFVLKSRYGESDVEDPVYYDGQCNKWIEMPSPCEILDYTKFENPRWYLIDEKENVNKKEPKFNYLF